MVLLIIAEVGTALPIMVGVGIVSGGIIRDMSIRGARPGRMRDIRAGIIVIMMTINTKLAPVRSASYAQAWFPSSLRVRTL